MVVKYATASAGLKTKGKEDILIVYFEKPLLVSALYTQNHFKAESVKYSMNLTKKRNRFRAFVVNSGNANCGTGKEGYKHAPAKIFVVPTSIEVVKVNLKKSR